MAARLFQRVFVTGAGGFVGSAVMEELVSRGYEVHALSHRREVQAAAGVRLFRGDLLDPASLDAALAGCDSAIHLVGIIMEKPGKGVTFERIHFEGTREVVDAVKRAGIRRYVHMSAMGVRPGAQSRYHKTKWQAEEYVRHSGLDWTIFRPSLIHGPRGEFMQMEAKWARKKAAPFLFMPYFGAGFLGRGGAGKLQPVYVGDVARAFADALESPKTIHETYLLGGPRQYTWPELHRVSAEAIVGRRRWVMPLPAWYAKAIATVTPAALLPFNKDQVIMSQEDNIGDTAKFRHDFGWEPRGFEEMLRSYAAGLA